MGVETAIAGSAIGAGLGLLSYREQRKARKATERTANESRQLIQQQSDVVRGEQTRLNTQLEQSKRKLAVGMARSNRRRSQGGLFGGCGRAKPCAVN